MTVDKLTATTNLSLGGSGSQFFAFNEDTVKVKFANWYSSNERQYGQGQLWYELFFAAADSSDVADNRRIGFYLETPNAGAADAVGGSGIHPSNARMFIDVDKVYIDSDLQVSGDITADNLKIIDSAGVTSVIDSSYIQVRARKGLTGGTGVTYNNTSGEISIDSNSTITINRVVADSGEIALLNFDENVYTDVDVPNNLPAFQEGNLFYFQGPDALTYSNASINVKLAQDEIVRVYNNTGTTIAKGKAVYITGATNDFPTIALAKADNFNTVYETQGLTSHSIPNNTYGYVTVRGLFGGLNTAAFNVGDIVHVSPDSAGQLVNFNPTHPNYAFEVGVVLVSDSAGGGNVGGCIQVNPRAEVFETQRTQGAARFDGNVTIAGNLNILGTETKTSVSSLEVGDQFIYVGGGDTVTGVTQEVGTGLNDVSFKGHYTGDNNVRYYVRISDDHSNHDKIQWSFDSDFATLQGFDSANGPTEVTLDSATPTHSLRHGISVQFEDENNHDSGDVFSGFAAPVNVDFGFSGNYNDSANPYTHAGFFRDATDSRFKFFNKYNPEPEGSIDTNDASFEYGDIQANRIYAALTGNVTGNVTGTVSDLSNHSTTNLSEGDNLYYTKVRVDSDIVEELTAVGRSIVPALDSTYDLGTSSLKWRDLYLSGNSLYLGGAQIHRDGDDFRMVDSQGNLVRLLASNIHTSLVDSSFVSGFVDSAYINARTTAGTDSSTVISIIDSDVDSDFIFNLTRIKSSKKYYIQPSQPTISEAGEYWYKSDSDILYKSVNSTSLSTTVPGYVVNGSGYVKLYDWALNYPSSVTRTDISGTDALGGVFTLGTTADAWFYFTPAFNGQQLNAGARYVFNDPVDIRGILIEDTSYNTSFSSGNVQRIVYSNGDYAAVQQSGPTAGLLTWYNSSNVALGKTARSDGNVFRDISHPTGVKATEIHFMNTTEHAASNDVFLFVAGEQEWEEIGRSRTDSDIIELAGSSDAGLDSGSVLSLIDSAYVSARAGTGGTDSSTVVAIIDSHVNVGFINALGAVDAETMNGESAGYYLDWNNVTSKPTIPVQNKTNIDALNINADTLDGQQGTYYTNYANFTGTPNVLDSSEVKDIFNENGDNQLVTNRVLGLEYLEFLHDSDVTTYLVEVGTKTTAHRYEGTGSANGYIIRDQESPMLQLVPGNKYRFDQSNGTNAGHPLRFYYDAAKTTQYTTNVTAVGNAGQAGAYTEIEVTDATPQVLHYQCTAHGYMGNAVFVMSRNLTGFDTDDISEGSTNLYYTDARVTAHVDSAYVAQRQDYSWSNITGVPKLIDSALVTQLVDSAYIAARESGTGSGSGGLDSDAIFNIIDSAYIQAREAVSAGGANVAFKTITVSGQDDIVAATATDTITFEAGSNVTLATDAATKTVTINSSGGGGGGSVADGLTLKKFTYTADSGQISFADSDDNGEPLVYNKQGVDINVYLNGVLLVDSADFTKTDSSTITFTDSAAAGDNITIVKFTPPEAAAEGVDSTATITLIQSEVDSNYIQARQGVLARGTLEVNKYFFEADQGDTVFSGDDKFGNTFLVDPDNTEVYINGILQELTTDYTIVDSNVTFTESLDSGYSVSVIETIGRVIKKTTLSQTTFQYIADSGQTTFSGIDEENLTMDLSSGVVEVYLNGILLSPLNDFTREANTITLTEAADSADFLSVVNTKGALVTGLNLAVTKFKDTTGTVLNKTGFSYTSGSIQVFKNGDLLIETTDYTATDGTNINLTSAAIASDVFIVQQFSTAKDLKTVQYQFLADSGQSTFTGEDRRGETLTYASNAVTVVYVNGIALQDSDDYSATNGYEITLTTAASLNDDIKILSYVPADLSKVASPLRLQNFEFTADSGQATFTGADDNSQTLSYSASRLHVYLNGILLQDADYTATNGTSVVLTEAADSGDVLTAVKYTGNNIGVDSATVLSLIDEDYIISNGGGGTVDSAGVFAIIDSSYIQARQTQASTWTTISTNIEIDSNSKNIIDTTTNPINLTLPPGPGFGTEVRIIDGGANAGSNNITIQRNAENIMGADSDLIIDIDEAAIGLVYYNTTRGWILIEN